MMLVDEKDASLKLLYQYLSLGESELAKAAFHRLCEIEKPTARKVLESLPETSEETDLVPKGDARRRTHTWPQQLWCLARSLSEFKDEEDESILLRVFLGVLFDQLSKEEDWEVKLYGEDAQDAPDVLGAALMDSEVTQMREGVLKILSGSKGGKLKEVLDRAAESKGIILWGIAHSIRHGIPESKWVPTGVSQFLHDCDMAFINAAEGFLQKESLKAAARTLSFVQGDRASVSTYRNVLQRTVKYMPSSFQADLLQVVLGSGNPVGLSKAVQEFMDISLQHKISEASPGGGSSENPMISKWKSAGFQVAKVMQRHEGAHSLKTMVGQCEKGNNIAFTDALNRGDVRTACFALLLAWDSLASGDAGQDFRCKRGLVEAMDLAFVPDAELVTAIANLKAQIEFAKVIALKQNGKDSDKKMGQILADLSRSSPLEQMNQSGVDMDSDMVRRMVECVADLPPDIHIPMVRDIQLVTASGVIVSMVAILKICSNLLDDKGADGYGKWLKEAQSLMETIKICIAGLKGSYIHAWLLGVLSAIFHMVAVKPDEMIGVELEIILGDASIESPGQNGKVVQVLEFLTDLLSMLSDSAESISKVVHVTSDPGEAGVDDAWDVSAAGVHLQFAKESLSGVISGLSILIDIVKAHPSKMVIQNGWVDAGSFLLLGEPAFEVMSRQNETLGKTVPQVTSDIDSWMKHGNVSGPEMIEQAGLLMDCCLSKTTDWEQASKATEVLTKALESIQSNGADIETFQLQALSTAVSGVRKVLEGAKSATDLSEVLGKFSGHVPPEGGKTTLKTVPRVRRLMEHIKALARLRDAMNAANRGRLQYLSGLLHNLSRALTSDDSLSDLRGALEVAGYGPSLELAVEARGKADMENVIPFSPRGKNAGYLSGMVNYLAAVGDVTSTWDDGPTEGHNYFLMLSQSPQEILSTLVSKSHTREHIEAAAKVANTLQVDLVREIRKTWLAPVLSPTFQYSDPQGSEAGNEYSQVQPLSLKHLPSRGAVNALAGLATVRVLLMCVMYVLQKDSLEVRGGDDGAASLEPISGVDEPDAVTMFALDKSLNFPTLRKWLESEVGKKSRIAVANALRSEMKGGEEADGIWHQIEGLLKEGKYYEAMQAGEDTYEGDMPDDMLAMIIDSFPADVVEVVPAIESGSDIDIGPLRSMPISLVACLKVKDRVRAIELGGKRCSCWPLESAIHFYSLMNGRLDAAATDPIIAQEVARKSRQLALYKKILETQFGGELKDWSEIDNLFENDPGQLVRRLIAAGAFAEAVKVVDMKPVTGPLQLAARATYTQEVANGCASRGSGPAAALQYLRTFSENDVFQIGMKVLTSAPSLRLCRLLVQFLMSLKDRLPPTSVELLEKLELGLAALRCLPSAWSDRCAHLVETPDLIVESLIMSQQTVSIRKLLKVVPALQNDNILIHYARKALGLGPDAAALPSFLAKKVDCMSPSTSNPTPAEKAGSEAGHQQTLMRFSSENARESGVAVNVLSGIASMDEEQRDRHAFRGNPNVTLFRVFLDMCSSPEAAAEAAARAAGDLASHQLENPSNDQPWDPVIAQQSLDAVEVCLEVLGYAGNRSPSGLKGLQTVKSPSDQREPDGQCEDPPHSDPDVAQGSSKEPNSSPPTEENVTLCSTLKTEVDILKKILEANIQCSLSNIRDPTLHESLLQQLIAGEQYHLAVCTAQHCGVDERPFWEAWVCALLREGNFEKAKEKVENVFRVKSGHGISNTSDTQVKAEAQQAAMRLVRVLETTCPVDIEAFKRLHESLKRSRWGFLRVSASTLVSTLRGTKPSSSQPKRWWKPSSEAAPPAPAPLKLGENIKKKVLAIAAISSTLLRKRITFAEELLAKHAPTMLMAFMFKHGRGKLACQVMFPPGMDDEVPTSSMTPSGSSRFGGHFRSSFAKSTSSRTGDAGSRSPGQFRRDVSRDSNASDITPGKDTGPSDSPARTASHGPSAQASNRPAAVSDEQHGSELKPIIADIDAHTLCRDIENVTQICEMSVRYAAVDALIEAMIKGGSRGRRCLREACTWLESKNKLWHLYNCQKALEAYDIAGMTCLELSRRSKDGKTALEFLESARSHFQDALQFFQKSPSGVPPKEKQVLSQSQLVQYRARCRLQSDIYKDLTSSINAKAPKDCFLFQVGAEETEEDRKRRENIALALITSNFRLAFNVINDFRMDNTHVYVAAARTMAEDRHHEAIRQLIHNIKGTIPDAELDRILGAAVETYTSTEAGNLGDDADWTSWFAEGCIELMVSPHAKVVASLQLGDTETAYQIAKERGGYQDLTMVAAAAQKLGDRTVAKKCEKILGRRQVP